MCPTAHPCRLPTESLASRVPSSWILGRCWERMFCCEMEPRKDRYFNMRHSEGAESKITEVDPQVVLPSLEASPPSSIPSDHSKLDSQGPYPS